MSLSNFTVKKIMAVVIMVQTTALYLCLSYDKESSPYPALKQSTDGQIVGAMDTDLRSIDTINQRRVERLRQYCSQYINTLIDTYPDYNKIKPSLKGLPSYVWLASPRHELFYCATPKCGSTTIKSYIMEDLKYNWTGRDTHESATWLGISNLLSKNRGVKKFLKEYRPDNRLIIVRNPWARLASAYDDKVLTAHWELEALCFGWKKYRHSTNVTFAQFIDCVLAKPPNIYYEQHTHPLTSLCLVCLMDYNIITKLEDMDRSERYLMHKLNFTTSPQYKPPRKMKNNDYKGRYQELSKEQIRQLQEAYKYDIEVFDYPKSPFD